MKASTVPKECLVSIGSGQQVRVRLLGRGPVLIMCHESPRSSAALLPLATRLANRFTCVMLDTPGFGLSDPLSLTRPEIPDYAAGVLAVTERLGVEKAAFYGTHTGAAIVIEVALQVPSLVSCVLLDGYALFSETERDELLASYLTPIQASLDGSHVAWLWSRVRDQFTAFPWHRVGDAGRLPFGPPPIETVQAVVEDFLLAGDHYRAGYSAAFRYDHLSPVQNAKVPVYLAAREDDLLFPHLQNARDLPHNVVVEHLPVDRDAWGHRIGDLFEAHAGDQPILDAEELFRQQSQIDAPAYIANTSIGTVLMRFNGEKTNAPLVVFHDAPGDMTSLDSLAEHLAQSHRVIRLDLPGSGNSRLNPDVEPTIATIVQGVGEALSSIDVDKPAIAAFGASLPVALAIGGEHRLLAVDPWTQIHAADKEIPDLSPRWDGAHLFAAFYWARDYELYKPWYHRNNAQGRKLGGERDVQQLHQRYRACVLGGASGIRACAEFYRANCSQHVSTATGELQVLLYGDDPDCPALQEWAESCVGNIRVQHVSRDPRQLARSISSALGCVQAS